MFAVILVFWWCGIIFSLYVAGGMANAVNMVPGYYVEIYGVKY